MVVRTLFLGITLLSFTGSGLAVEASSPVDPLWASFQRAGISVAPNDAGAVNEESLRQRVCRARVWLNEPAAMAQIASDWLTQDFAGRSAAKQKTLLSRFMVVGSGADSYSLSIRYAQFLAKESEFKVADCDRLRLWHEKHASFAAKLLGSSKAACSQSQRAKTIFQAVASREFVLSRLDGYLKEVTFAENSLRKMYEVALELGDFTAALAVQLAGDKTFRDVNSVPEPFGVPVGPYACSDSSDGIVPKPVFSTSYYYWYDFADPVSGQALPVQVLNWERMFSLVPVSTAGMHFANARWHRNQIDGMVSAGINLVFPVFRGGPVGRFTYSDTGLVALVKGLLETRSLKLKVAGLVDGFLFSTRGNTLGERIDLSTPRGGIILAATMRNFYSMVPEPLRGRKGRKLMVALKDVSQARRIGLDGLEQFRDEFAGIFGAEPYLIFPREEMVKYVARSNPRSVGVALDRLTQAVPAVDVLSQMLQLQPLSAQLGGSDLEIMKHFLIHECLGPFKAAQDAENWWQSAKTKLQKRVGVSKGVQRCFPTMLERHHSRILGIEPRYRRKYPPRAEVLKKELALHLAEYYADVRFFPHKNPPSREEMEAIAVSVLGRCATANDVNKMTSMFSTWDRKTAMGYVLSTEESFQRLVAGWHVDHLMTSPLVVSNEIYWNGYDCSQLPGIAVIVPGRNDRHLAKAMRRPAVVTDRNYGRLYSGLWELLSLRKQYPDFVHIESWNGFHDGTAIAPTLEYQTRYLELTRDYIGRYRKEYRASRSKRDGDRQISSVPAKQKR